VYLYQISCLLVKKKKEIIGHFAHSPQNSAKMLARDEKIPSGTIGAAE